jgi:transcription elongation factor Elf1
MKTIITGLLMVFVVCGCSKSEDMNSESAAEQIDRYNKPVDAAGAAADQVQQIHDQDGGQ